MSNGPVYGYRSSQLRTTSPPGLTVRRVAGVGAEGETPTSTSQSRTR